MDVDVSTNEGISAFGCGDEAGSVTDGTVDVSSVEADSLLGKAGKGAVSAVLKDSVRDDEIDFFEDFAADEAKIEASAAREALIVPLGGFVANAEVGTGGSARSVVEVVAWWLAVGICVSTVEVICGAVLATGATASFGREAPIEGRSDGVVAAGDSALVVVCLISVEGGVGAIVDTGCCTSG